MLNWSDFYQQDWLEIQQDLDIRQIRRMILQIGSRNYIDTSLGIRSITFKGYEFNNY